MPREGKPEQLQHLHSDFFLCFLPLFPFLVLLIGAGGLLTLVAEMRVYNILHIAQRQMEHMGSQWMSVDFR